MGKAIPNVRKFMTSTPVTIGPRATLKEAHELMKERGFRHLPVLKDNDLIGILSERDLALIGSIHGTDIERLLVADAMTVLPYHVAPEASLFEVVSEMASNKYGSAIVVENGKVVGIFTAVDALSAFAELLLTQFAL